MNWNHFLLKIGIRELNAWRMGFLVSEGEDDMIRWAFENGRYDVRLQAVHYFEHSSVPLANRILLEAIYDETGVVAYAAITAMEKRIVSEEVQVKIEERKQFWIELKAHREERRNREHTANPSFREPKERGSKKSFDNFRAMLQKPMNTGKWF